MRAASKRPVLRGAAVDDDAPSLLVIQIKAHWKKYRPRMSRELRAAGKFDEAVRSAAILTSDATYDTMTSHGLNPDQARELLREEWVFLPTEADDDDEDETV